MVGIKNFEMPHNCYDCDLHNYHECDLTSESIEDDYCWNGDSREKHCPLRELEAIPKEKIAAATNKIISCSLGKWYVGRTDGAPDEVVLLDDVLRVMSELLEDRI